MTFQTSLSHWLIVALACLTLVGGARAQDEAATTAGPAIELPDLSGFSRGELLQMWYDGEIGTVVYSDEIARRDEMDHWIAAVLQYVSISSEFATMAIEGPMVCGIGLESFGPVQLEMPPVFVENTVVQEYLNELDTIAPLADVTLLPMNWTVEDISIEGLEGLIAAIEQQDLMDSVDLKLAYYRYWDMLAVFGTDSEEVNAFGAFLNTLREGGAPLNEDMFDVNAAYDHYRGGTAPFELSTYEPKRQLIAMLLEAYENLGELPTRYGDREAYDNRVADLTAELQAVSPMYVETSPAATIRGPDSSAPAGNAAGPETSTDAPTASGSGVSQIFNEEAEFFRMSFYAQNGRQPTAEQIQEWLQFLPELKETLNAPDTQRNDEDPSASSAGSTSSETSSTSAFDRDEAISELEVMAQSLRTVAPTSEALSGASRTIERIEQLVPALRNPTAAGASAAALSPTEMDSTFRELRDGYQFMRAMFLERYGATNPVIDDRLREINDSWRALQRSIAPPPAASPEDNLLDGVRTTLQGSQAVPGNSTTEQRASSQAAAVPAPPVTTVQVFVKAKDTVLQTGSEPAQAIAGAQITQLFPPAELPGTGVAKADSGADGEPVKGTSDDDGFVALGLSSEDAEQSQRRADLFEQVLRWGTAQRGGAPLLAQPDAVGSSAAVSSVSPTGTGSFYSVDVEPFESYVIEGERGQTIESLVSELPAELVAYIVQRISIDSVPFVTTLFSSTVSTTLTPLISELDSRAGIVVQLNFCRTKQAPDDPSFVQTAAAGRAGSWGQTYDDQWAIKRVGLTAEADSAWNSLGDNPQPVNVAVIDTGLDWNHLDIDWANIWRNGDEIPNNEIDDDGNGYVDDVIGWDFIGQGNKPWDHDGHGTIVSGIIAATQGNNIGIAGINPHAKIMVLKSLNAFGNTRASFIAEAILYAADNGAKLVNVSVGGSSLSRIEKAAVDYANSKDVMIVAAAGNEGISLEDYGPGGLPGVLTVSATDLDDARTVFSNWGTQVDIAAPGMEVLSLRARRTDTMRDIPGVEYINAANYVGQDKRYYRVSGTSFAAPIVTGIASLIASREPDVSNVELRRMLTQSAEDVDAPGKDQFTGYGIVDAKLALTIERDFFIESTISGVGVVQVDGQPALQVNGTADASDFGRAWLEIGAGENPTDWKRIATEIDAAVSDGSLLIVPAQEFAGSTVWMLKLVTEDRDGKQRQAWFRLALG